MLLEAEEMTAEELTAEDTTELAADETAELVIEEAAVLTLDTTELATVELEPTTETLALELTTLEATEAAELAVDEVEPETAGVGLALDCAELTVEPTELTVAETDCVLETIALAVLEREADRDAESEARELAGVLELTVPTGVEEEAAIKLLVDVSPGEEEEAEEGGTATLEDVEMSVDAACVDVDSAYTDEDAGVADDSAEGVKLGSTDEVGFGDGVGSLEDTGGVDVITSPTGQSTS